MIDYTVKVLFKDCGAYLGPNIEMDLNKGTYYLLKPVHRMSTTINAYCYNYSTTQMCCLNYGLSVMTF